MDNPQPPAELILASDLARYLKCGKSTVYKMAQEGKIPTVSIGSRGVRFDLAAVLQALQRKDDAQ